MRLIFWVLLLACLIYPAWHRWGSEWYDSLEIQPALSVETSRPAALTLLSEKVLIDKAAAEKATSPVISRVATEVSPGFPVRIPVTDANVGVEKKAHRDVDNAASPIPVNNPVVDLVCREFGAFDNREEVERFRKLLNVQGEVEERYSRKASAHWLVLASTEQDVARASELNAFLVQQGLFMSKPEHLPDLQGRSVVGPFVSAKVAQSYQARLQELHVDTKVYTVDEGRKEFWFRAEFQNEYLPVVVAAYNGYVSGSQGDSVTQLVCN